MTKRGEPLPINQAMNRPRAKLGLDLSTWMAIVFVNVTVFLVGFRLLAMVSIPMMAVGAWLIEIHGRETTMLDLTFLAATVAFVLLAVLYVQACDRLRLKK